MFKYFRQAALTRIFTVRIANLYLKKFYRLSIRFTLHFLIYTLDVREGAKDLKHGGTFRIVSSLPLGMRSIPISTTCYAGLSPGVFSFTRLKHSQDLSLNSCIQRPHTYSRIHTHVKLLTDCRRPPLDRYSSPYKLTDSCYI